MGHSTITETSLKMSVGRQLNELIMYFLQRGMRLSERHLEQRALEMMREKCRYALTTAEADELIQKVLPEIKASISKKIVSLSKREKLSAMNFVVAKSLLKAKFDELGYTYQLEQQLYRVKVYVRLNERRMVTFFMRYRTLEQDIEQLEQALRSMKQVIDFMGNDMRLQSEKGMKWIKPKKCEI